MDIKNQLKQLAEEKYQKFSSMLMPNINNILGVRIPILRKLSKEIYKSADWKAFLSTKEEFMEETMLKGMVIGLIKDTPKNILKYVEDFVQKIDNWAVCDSFCSSLKFVNNNKEIMWEFIQKYTLSDDEFLSRFAFVIILNYFIEEKYLDEVFKILNQFKNEKFYSKMSVAWLVSICYIKFPNKTEEFLKSTNLDNFTFKKSIQKIGESNRIDRKSEEYKRLKMIR